MIETQKDLSERWSAALEEAHALMAIPGNKVVTLKQGKPIKVQMEVTRVAKLSRIVTLVRGLEEVSAVRPVPQRRRQIRSRLVFFLSRRMRTYLADASRCCSSPPRAFSLLNNQVSSSRVQQLHRHRNRSPPNSIDIEADMDRALSTSNFVKSVFIDSELDR